MQASTRGDTGGDDGRQEATARRNAAPAPGAISSDCALFLDVDGCLLDFDDDPASTTAGPRLRATLAALKERLDGALALVSGRDLSSLARIFGGDPHLASGLHGLQSGVLATGTDALGGLSTAVLDDVAAGARARLARWPGAVVEHKGRAVALHWRGAPDAREAALGYAGAALRTLDGYALQHGNCVVELRPHGTDKGTAIAAFLAQAPFAGRRPVFAGDDLTDEAGFAVVNARGGDSVLVGERAPSAARYRLADPAAVLAWLEQMP